MANMKKGPLLNNNIRNFTTRDSLGIENVAASISAELCPVVNTVTPRAFYWPFLVWIYYDFYKYSGIEEHTRDVFDKEFLKRQDYFFVLSQLLIDAPDQAGLVGKNNSIYDIWNNKTGPYVFNPNYFIAPFGGMQYYNAGCVTMDYIREIDVDTNKAFSFPKLTRSGEEMALEFQGIIKDTEYYKRYRLNNVPVPKDVLLEYGNVINIGLKGFEVCKKNLRKHLFENERLRMLRDSADYVKYIFEKYDMTDATLFSYRDILFDAFSVRGRDEELKPELRSISNGWEIVVGRQYFTSGLESIWKYMLNCINFPLTKKEWIQKAIEETDWSFDMDTMLSEVLKDCEYDFETREAMISDAAHNDQEDKMADNGLKIVLSIYNRFVNRTDLGREKAYLTWGNDSSSISFEELIIRVDEYRNKSVKEFLVFVMDQWLIEQHFKTAFEKLLQKRDGFYFEIVNDRYVRTHEFDIRFQGLRLFQLASVMKDLELL